ncbi:hypothetical protein CBL_11524 [Carabus blaptoides fortunei]
MTSSKHDKREEIIEHGKNETSRNGKTRRRCASMRALLFAADIAVVQQQDKTRKYNRTHLSLAKTLNKKERWNDGSRVLHRTRPMTTLRSNTTKQYTGSFEVNAKKHIRRGACQACLYQAHAFHIRMSSTEHRPSVASQCSF